MRYPNEEKNESRPLTSPNIRRRENQEDGEENGVYREKKVLSKLGVPSEMSVGVAGGRRKTEDEKGVEEK